MWCLLLAKRRAVAELIELLRIMIAEANRLQTSKVCRRIPFGLSRSQSHSPKKAASGADDLAALNARQGLDAHFMSARLEDDNAGLFGRTGESFSRSKPLIGSNFSITPTFKAPRPVGAMVCYINGEPAKGMYRKFHLDEKDAGDDYHSMKEITYRRYKRLKRRESCPIRISSSSMAASPRSTLRRSP
jgi:excinuclease UvrABC nuclease subunit